MPRLRSAVLPSLAALALTLSACGSDADNTSSAEENGGDGPVVAAAFYPLAFAAEQVAGDHAEVENLTSPGVEPHDAELGIGQTSQLNSADLVVYSSGFQPALDDAIAEHGGDGVVLDVADVVELRPADEHAHDEEEHAEGHPEDEHADEHAEEGEHAEEAHAEDEHAEEEAHADEDAGDEHDHGEFDPHFWLDPLLMADLGDGIADRLAEADPDNAEDYRANAEAFREELTTLDGEYADGLASCERDHVVVSHDAFGYLTRYGLHFVAIAGLSPDAEPSPAELADLAELIEEEGVTTVFSETLVSPKLAETLAREVGVETAVLDPIEGLSDQTEGEDYLSLMRTNLAALSDANDC